MLGVPDYRERVSGLRKALFAQKVVEGNASTALDLLLLYFNITSKVRVSSLVSC